VIRVIDTVGDERVDKRREILVPGCTATRGEGPKLHEHRRAMRQIPGRVATLDQPRGVLLDRGPEP
jgi:hypothetical protein